jgi:hypothetical protein
MQHVEENMDDLFRKAADNYMPNPGESRWDAVEPQLLNEPAASAAPVMVIKKKEKRNGLLLLLPFIAGGLSYYFINHNNEKPLTTISNSTKQIYRQAQNQQQKNDGKLNVNKEKVYWNLKNNTGSQKITYAQNTSAVDPNVSMQNISKRNIMVESSAEKLPGLVKEISKTLPVATTEENINIGRDTNTQINHASSAKKIIIATKYKRVYAGIVLGPEFNQVKNQGFRKAGFNAGLIAGYKLNKNISVETGLLYSKKYYFTDGKYFDKKASSMPADMQIISLKGSRNLFEIPLDVKYNIVYAKASSVFASAGISSYILLKENNQYHASVNGNQQNLKGLYKNVSTGLVSSIDFSIGYEHTIGKQSAVQIRPYMQIPVKGLGAGNMQILSTGINIGITRSF